MHFSIADILAKAITLSSLTILGPGALALADLLVLEKVEVRRVKYGYGLDHFADINVARVAVEDCRLLGYQGILIADEEVFSVYVVDCQQKEHTSLSELGILADVNKQELECRQATMMLWKEK